MRVIGIDLGTINSAVAAWTEEDPELIPNAPGEELTPSVVGLNDDNAVLVGQPAGDRLVTYPERAIASCKELRGHRGGAPRGARGNRDDGRVPVHAG